MAIAVRIKRMAKTDRNSTVGFLLLVLFVSSINYPAPYEDHFNKVGFFVKGRIGNFVAFCKRVIEIR